MKHTFIWCLNIALFCFLCYSQETHCFAGCFFANFPFLCRNCYGTGLNLCLSYCQVDDKTLLSAQNLKTVRCAEMAKAKVHKPKILTIIEQMPLLYTFCYSYYNCKSKAVDTRWAVIILRRSLMTSRYDFSTVTVLWGTFDCL